MIGALYRKLYLYVVLSVFVAIGLTVLMMNLVFQRNENDMRERFVQDQVGFVQYVLQHVAEQEPANTALLTSQIEKLGDYLNWEISYWKGQQLVYAYGQANAQGDAQPPQALTPADIQSLLGRSEPLIRFQANEQTRTQAFALLNPNKPELGYLQYTLNHPGPPPLELKLPRTQGPPPGPPKGAMMRPGPKPKGFHWFHLLPPLIFGVLILLTLAVLLIPYMLYILKPFRELSASIERVAQGDFSRPIDVGAKSDFAVIAQAFNHMVERIQAMIEDKQRLMADVSHELRSPLARMRVSLELLHKEGKGKAKYIDRSIQELEELDHLINDILDISALELNAENYPLEKVELSQLVRENLESHQLIFQERGLHVVPQFPTTSVVINGRRDLLDRALNNLFSNVLKYAPESSQVDVRVFVEDQKAGICIRDRGPGLEAEELDKILQPFYRPDSSRTRKTGGNGLGLAIVVKIMSLHKGRLHYSLPEDTEGGLAAWLEWPVQRSPQTAQLENL